MSKRASPAILGGFIVGAIVLIVAGILVFGSRKFTSEDLTYVLNFDGSVKGLDTGAPVMFRGVKVGVVSNIRLIVNSKGSDIKIPVTINLDPSTLTQMNGDIDSNAGQYVHQMIANGLTAELQMQSLITGKLLIELEFDNNRGSGKVDNNHGEIPTKQSIIKQLQKRMEALQLEEIPIEEILHQGIKAVQAVETILTSPELMGIIKGLNLTLIETQKLARNMDKRLEVLGGSMQETMTSSRQFAGAAMETLQVIKNAASDNSALRYQLIDAFKELSSTARSVRVMTDYLHQHPESLFYGKGSK